MFWIVLKIVVFLLAVAGLTLGAEALMNSGQGLRIAVMDTEFTLGPVQAALAALAILAGLWLLLKLAGLLVATVRFINGDTTAVSRYFETRRKRQGLEALTEGFLALASGDGTRAVAKARRAEAYLENKTLTNLLMAQAAQAKGNTELAEDYYKRIVSDDRARFVGVQGLLAQRLAAGDRDTARALAEKALGMQPAHAPTQDTLLGLQTRAADWSGARKTLMETARTGRLPRDVFRRRDAVLALQQADALGDTDAARDLVIEANGLSPELVPAAVRAAIAKAARGKGSAAAKIVKRAWAAQPHPELAQAFAAIEPQEAATARVKRFEKLLSLTPDHDETRLTRAELLIAAEDFPGARRALGDLAERAPTQRALTIMAAIERGEGSDDAVVRGWLARALTAPRGPHWCCDKCQHIHARWAPLCENCAGFDTLSWRAPPDSSGPSATGTEMLPLIVGALTAAPQPASDAEPSDATRTEVAAEPVVQPQGELTEPAGPRTIDLTETRRSGM
jgi:HemY protein